jgi:hypothetical protein
MQRPLMVAMQRIAEDDVSRGEGRIPVKKNESSLLARTYDERLT